jgi:hypothetical protein
MMAGLAMGALLAARAIPVDALYIFVGLSMQQVLDARAPRLKPAGRGPMASVRDEPTKVCPNCEAEIRRSARLCYCNQSFDPQPRDAPTTSAPARRPSHSTNEMTCGRRNCNVPAQSAEQSHDIRDATYRPSRRVSPFIRDRQLASQP